MPDTEKNPGHLKVAVVSMKSVFSDTEDPAVNAQKLQENLDRHAYFIDRLADEGAEFIGFPETSINGYHFSENMTWLQLDGPEIAILQMKAIEKQVYVGAGLAEVDRDGKKWNTQVVIAPDGEVVGVHRKSWLTKERGFVESSKERNVFPVKGMKMGIAICADGTDFRNLKALADGGAKIIYGPHANTTGGTTEGWFTFRGNYVGPSDFTPLPSRTYEGTNVDMPTAGWIATLKIYAALCNHARIFNPQWNPPPDPEVTTGWASGTLIVGPDGNILAQKPVSSQKEDTAEFYSIVNIPLTQ